MEVVEKDQQVPVLSWSFTLVQNCFFPSMNVPLDMALMPVGSGEVSSFSFCAIEPNTNPNPNRTKRNFFMIFDF
jgi:hypothetical protein